MSVISTNMTKLLGKLRDGRSAGRSRPPVSQLMDLQQHIELQCSLWEGICHRICHHAELLGTENMVHYSNEERMELDLMIRNMQEFASNVKGALGEKVSTMAISMQQALESYDNFCGGIKGSKTE